MRKHIRALIDEVRTRRDATDGVAGDRTTLGSQAVRVARLAAVAHMKRHAAQASPSLRHAVITKTPSRGSVDA